jgi:hypothetical protein
MTSQDAGSGGIGFSGLLTVVFITLKLTHYIDWSWLWVLSPLWISFAAAIALIIVVLLIAGGGMLWEGWKHQRYVNARRKYDGHST